MYLDEYKRWLAADLEDSDLHPELAGIEGNDDEIKDRFAVALKFGTAGLRGVLGAGTNVRLHRVSPTGSKHRVATRQLLSAMTAVLRVMFLPRLLLPFSPLMELKFAFTMH